MVLSRREEYREELTNVRCCSGWMNMFSRTDKIIHFVVPVVKYEAGPFVYEDVDTYELCKMCPWDMYETMVHVESIGDFVLGEHWESNITKMLGVKKDD